MYARTMIHTLTRLKSMFFSRTYKLEPLGLTPPTLIKITAVKVKMVGRSVNSGAGRAIFALDLSYNVTQLSFQKCSLTCAFQS
jgi:hypothetical protein